MAQPSFCSWSALPGPCILPSKYPGRRSGPARPKAHGRDRGSKRKGEIRKEIPKRERGGRRELETGSEDTERHREAGRKTKEREKDRGARGAWQTAQEGWGLPFHDLS